MATMTLTELESRIKALCDNVVPHYQLKAMVHRLFREYEGVEGTAQPDPGDVAELDAAVEDVRTRRRSRKEPAPVPEPLPTVVPPEQSPAAPVGTPIVSSPAVGGLPPQPAEATAPDFTPLQTATVVPETAPTTEMPGA
jgi:hypothetical protein